MAEIEEPEYEAQALTRVLNGEKEPSEEAHAQREPRPPRHLLRPRGRPKCQGKSQSAGEEPQGESSSEVSGDSGTETDDPCKEKNLGLINSIYGSLSQIIAALNMDSKNLNARVEADHEQLQTAMEQLEACHKGMVEGDQHCMLHLERLEARQDMFARKLEAELDFLKEKLATDASVVSLEDSDRVIERAAETLAGKMSTVDHTKVQQMAAEQLVGDMPATTQETVQKEAAAILAKEASPAIQTRRLPANSSMEKRRRFTGNGAPGTSGRHRRQPSIDASETDETETEPSPTNTAQSEHFKARRRSRRMTEKEYKRHLATQRDVLAIQREIMSLRGAIVQLKQSGGSDREAAQLSQGDSRDAKRVFTQREIEEMVDARARVMFERYRQEQQRQNSKQVREFNQITTELKRECAQLREQLHSYQDRSGV